MNFYNTVLLPSPETSQAAAQWAKTNLGEIHAGYLAGESTPHITLAQHKGEERTAKEYEAAVKDLPGKTIIPEIEYERYYVQQLELDGEPYLYLGVEVKKTSELQNLHNTIVKLQKSFGIQADGRTGDDYWPHLTLGRVRPEFQSKVEGLAVPTITGRTDTGCKIMFGNGDSGGQLFPRRRPS